MDPQTTESAGWLWNLFTVGGNLSAILISILAFIRSCRRQPPLSEEMYKDFVSKGDFEKLRKEINISLASGTTLFREIERSVGQIEGQLKYILLFFGIKFPERKDPP